MNMDDSEIKAIRLTNAKSELAICRTGDILEHGYAAWLKIDVAREVGVTFEDLETTLEEIRNYLVIDLKNWLKNFREAYPDLNTLALDLITIELLAENSQLPGLIEELGTSKEELDRFEASFVSSGP
jgi:hypothetical protein